MNSKQQERLLETVQKSGQGSLLPGGRDGEDSGGGIKVPGAQTEQETGKDPCGGTDADDVCGGCIVWKRGKESAHFVCGERPALSRWEDGFHQRKRWKGRGSLRFFWTDAGRR